MKIKFYFLSFSPTVSKLRALTELLVYLFIFVGSFFSETHGYTVTFSPAAVLGTGLGVSAAVGCLPSVSVQNGSGSSTTTVHAPMTLEADDLFIRCDDAVFRGAQIRARLLEAIVTNDLTIETLADEFRSDSHSSAISGNLSAIYGMVQSSESDAGLREAHLRDPGLGAVPTMRFANEREMTRRIDELAELVGTERFYLTVGNLLRKKSALVGLAPDGVVTHSENERINAAQVLEEKVQEAHSHKRRVFNPSIGEFFAMMDQVDEFNQLRNKIQFEELLKNTPKEERRQIDRDMQKVQAVVHRADVQAEAKQKVAIQKLRESVAEKAPELVEETSKMSDAEFAMFVDQYATLNSDSFAQQILQEDSWLKLEEQKLYEQAGQELEALPLSEKAKYYGDAVREVISEYAKEISENPLEHAKELAIGTTQLAGDLLLPGGVEAPIQYLRGETTGTEAMQAYGIALGTDLTTATVAKKLRVGEKVCKLYRGVKNKLKSVVAERIIERKFKQSMFTGRKIPLEGPGITEPMKGMPAPSGIHKNSLKYEGETHVYHIMDSEGKEFKIGESAQGMNNLGQSKRAVQQARRLRKETGKPFETEIIATFPGKKEARKFETKTILERRANDPDALPGNKGVH